MIILTLFISFSAAIVDFLVEKELTIVSRSYGFIVPILIILPHLARNFSVSVKWSMNKEWLRHFDWYVFFIIAINIPGSIYLHKIGVQYDRFIHFGSVFFMVFIVLIFYILIQTQFRKKIIRKNIALVFCFTTIFISLFIWEWYQYFIDGVFGSKLFYDVTQNIIIDTKEDILYGLLGLIVGIFYIGYSFSSFLVFASRPKG